MMTSEHVYSIKPHKNILILTENEPSSIILLSGTCLSVINGKLVSKQA